MSQYQHLLSGLLVPESSHLHVGGWFEFWCFDVLGKLKWRSLAKNGVTNGGLDHILDVEFHAATQLTTWYISLINTGASLAAADTMDSHAGWAENENYSEATRPEWTEGAASSQSITNASTVDFSIDTDSQTIYGAFLCSNSTKGGTSGTLFCTGAFSGGEQPANDGDTIKVTYTLSASAA